MFMKKAHLIFITFILCFGIDCISQTVNEVKKSGKYIYGIGRSNDYDKADKLALNDLISQISVNVKGEFGYERTDSNFVYKEYAKSVIKTYSTATLNNVPRIEEEKNGIYNVVRYMQKEDLSKVFEKRKVAIIEYLKEGVRSEWKLQIADAIRNYYWANILLISHPDYNGMKYFNGRDSLLLKVHLPNKINEIFSNINIEIIEQSYNQLEKYSKCILGLKYKGDTIQSLDYTFKTKNSWSSTINAKNGLACLEFYGDDAKKGKDVKIRIEYKYKDKAFFDRDVQSVMSSGVDLPSFSNQEMSASIKKVKSEKNDGEISISQISKEKANTQKIKSFIEIVIKGLKNKNSILNTAEYFTPDGLIAFNKLLKEGNAMPLLRDNELKTVKINNETLVRSIPMRLTFSKNRQFIEDVVFILDENNKIKDINFSLSKIAIKDILSKDERFATTEEKYFIIRFLENYKTAYCSKRIDYLQQVFDEEALIIVGSILKKRKTSDASQVSFISNKEVEYQRLSKKEYISRLERIFKLNEFVNLHFEDNIVKKAKKDMSIYGIQIAQHYTSDTYADKGYLFLMVDLRDMLNPIVHVRTWQPQKNADGSIYGLNDFPIENI